MMQILNISIHVMPADGKHSECSFRQLLCYKRVPNGLRGATIARPPNHVIQVFQSPPWTHVYTIKPLGMQTASTNIGERMGRSQELSDSKRGPVIGGHLGNKSIRDISWLLNIPRSTVSGIITKWKPLGTTATQP
ncbi:unnamed protein product, partial [Staurois parvus]